MKIVKIISSVGNVYQIGFYIGNYKTSPKVIEIGWSANDGYFVLLEEKGEKTKVYLNSPSEVWQIE